LTKENKKSSKKNVLKADVWKNPLKKAMEAIEDENPKMDVVLPKEVTLS